VTEFIRDHNHIINLIYY